MAKKVKIGGAFSRDNAINYVEDIINSAGVTLISTQFIKSGDNIYNVIVIYDDGVVPTNDKSVKSVKNSLKGSVK